MFTGLYVRWDSFAAANHKINLIESLMSRVRRICSLVALNMEVEAVKGLFVDNGYLSCSVQRIVKQMLDQTLGIVRQMDQHECVSLWLPWIGFSSVRFCREIENTVRRGFVGIAVRVHFSTTRVLTGK